MLKQMLVLLEEHDHSRAAIEYGAHLAKHGNVKLTGLSVVDIPSIEKSIGPVPIGGTYYAQREEMQRMETEKRELSAIEEKFVQLCKTQKIDHSCLQRQGNAEELIIDEAKYNDLLIMGYETSIKYGHGKDTTLQKHLIGHGICPILLIPAAYKDIQRVLLCYDGSVQSTKTIHAFVQFGIWQDREITLLTVQKEKDAGAGEYLLSRMVEYMDACCQLKVKRICLHGDHPQMIAEYADNHEIDLIVMGAYGKHTLHNFFFGSTVDTFLTKADRPVFVYH